MNKRALICGVSGQDGAYLSQLLLAKGYTVFGTSRDAETTSFAGLVSLGIRQQVRCVSMSLTDFRSALQVIDDVAPDEIYHLAGQSSVGLSFQHPVETLESIAFGTLNLLEVLRFRKSKARFYNASSSECFGETSFQHPANEDTAFHPRSPYGVAKAAAFWATVNYREAFGLKASSGILFNHESPLRPERFVTQKIVRGACRIAAGSKEKLRLGNLDVVRDWGWAPDYADAMWRMMQIENPRDFVIASGRSHSLAEFTQKAFSNLGLNWRDHILVDSSLLRAADIALSHANPVRAAQELGWTATLDFDAILDALIQAEQLRLAKV